MFLHVLTPLAWILAIHILWFADNKKFRNVTHLRAKLNSCGLKYGNPRRTKINTMCFFIGFPERHQLILNTAFFQIQKLIILHANV